jgi:sugar phosphate isomerase/epimerase
MYVSLNGALVAGGKVGGPDFARLAARFGYPGVDVNLAAAMQEGAEQTRALLDHLRLKPSCVSFPVEFRKDDATFQDGLKKLGASARFATAIGCPRMTTWIMSSSETPKSELRSLYKKRFGAAARVLAEHKVRLGLEFLGPLHIRKRFPHEFIWRMPEMLEFARECGLNVGLLLDAWHWHHAGATVQDIRAAGKAGVVHVHVSDAPNVAPEKILDGDRLMPGEGVIDFNAFFGALKRIGYEDGVSPEVLGPRARNLTPEEGARVGLETTLRVMKKAGVA